MDRANGLKGCRWERPRGDDDDDDKWDGIYGKENCDRQYTELFKHVTYLLYPVVLLFLAYLVVWWIGCCCCFGKQTGCAPRHYCDYDAPWNCYKCGCCGSRWGFCE